VRVAPAARPRSLPWIAAGLLLVVGCALLFALGSARLGARRAVLAVARAVPAGQLVEERDLTVVRISTDPGLRPLPASARDAVRGRPAAVPLVPGTLLTAAQLGAPATLGPGEAVIGLALKPGQFPPGLAAGASVLVAEAGGDSPGTPPAVGGALRAVRATILEVTAPADAAADPGLVTAVKLPAAAAPALAAAGAAGRVVVVVLAPAAP
jgi:hypothetical protein